MTSFDRIDVSSIIATDIRAVLADWTPLLSSTNAHATLLGAISAFRVGPKSHR